MVDDFNVFNVNPCSYFSLNSSVINPSCNQFNDGFASVTATNDTLYNDTYSYLWSDGQTGDTATNLSSGTYSCIVTGNTFGCVDTIDIILQDKNPDAELHHLKSNSQSFEPIGFQELELAHH